MALSTQREIFCKEFVADGNQTQACIRAGYSPQGAKKHASRLMGEEEVRTRIAELMAEKDAQLIASGDEVLRYLTAVLRGGSPEGREGESGVPKAGGGGEAPIRERLKAAELLGKRYGLFTDKVALEGAVPVTIVDDVPEVSGDEC